MTKQMIQYHKRYNPANIRYKVIHHAGGFKFDPYASTLHLTAFDINKAHFQRWHFPSSLKDPDTGHPWYGGYNFWIDKDGKWTQFRAVGEETAAQRGHNFDSISYGLAGNYVIDPVTGTPVDRPTTRQADTLAMLLNQAPRAPVRNVIPHRVLARTVCYGDSLKDAWARNLIQPPPPETTIELIQQLTLARMIAQLLLKVIDLQRKLRSATRRLGGALPDCADCDVRG